MVFLLYYDKHYMEIILIQLKVYHKQKVRFPLYLVGQIVLPCKIWHSEKNKLFIGKKSGGEKKNKYLNRTER